MRRGRRTRTDLERRLGGLTPRWGDPAWSEAEAFAAIVERQATDARSLLWLTRWASRGMEEHLDVLMDDNAADGDVIRLLVETGGWYVPHAWNDAADRGRGPDGRPLGRRPSPAHDRVGDLEPRHARGRAHEASGPQGHGGGHRDPHRRSPRRILRGSDRHGPTCACVRGQAALASPSVAALLRCCAEARVLLAIASGLAPARAAWLVAPDLLVVRGMPWRSGPWRADVVLFRDVAREPSDRRGARAIEPVHCGLCGLRGGPDLDSWALAHPVGGAAARDPSGRRSRTRGSGEDRRAT